MGNRKQSQNRNSEQNHQSKGVMSTDQGKILATNPSLDVRDRIVVKDSATIICVRRRIRNGNEMLMESSSTSSMNEEAKQRAETDGNGSPSAIAQVTKLKLSEFKSDIVSDIETWSESHPALDSIKRLFDEDNGSAIIFESDFEVLVAQAEVVNWLKSKAEKIETRRYAGEYLLAGGEVDQGETPLEAARRELEEEFLSPFMFSEQAGLKHHTSKDAKLPKDAVIRPFSVAQTRPIRSRSNIMHNFVALDIENPWLRDINVDELNLALKARKAEFLKRVKKDIDKQEEIGQEFKETYSPEVHEVKWLPLHEAVKHCLSSLIPGMFVNKWQEEQFKLVKRKARDPMFLTAGLLLELESFPSFESLIDHCNKADFAAMRKEAQFLFTGMTASEVKAAFRPSGKSPVKSGKELRAIRRSRL